MCIFLTFAFLCILGGKDTQCVFGLFVHDRRFPALLPDAQGLCTKNSKIKSSDLDNKLCAT